MTNGTDIRTQLKYAARQLDAAEHDSRRVKDVRDKLIRQAHGEGAPMRTIAEWANMSHQRVEQIIKAA